MSDKQISALIIGLIGVLCGWKDQGIACIICIVAMCTILGGC